MKNYDSIEYMKTVYFVRHGESEGNVGDRQQAPESPLNTEGLLQAQKVAERLSKIPFQTLVASPFIRTVQTAHEISKKTRKDFTQHEFLIERLRPSEQVGGLKDSDFNRKSQELYLEAFVKGETYKDGESFADLVSRAKQTLEFLDSAEQNEIVVVTHGIFLRVLCAYIILGDTLTAEICSNFMHKMSTENTGVTMIQNDGKGWKILTWNDHSHL